MNFGGTEELVGHWETRRILGVLKDLCGTLRDKANIGRTEGLVWDIKRQGEYWACWRTCVGHRDKANIGRTEGLVWDIKRQGEYWAYWRTCAGQWETRRISSEHLSQNYAVMNVCFEYRYSISHEPENCDFTARRWHRPFKFYRQLWHSPTYYWWLFRPLTLLSVPSHHLILQRLELNLLAPEFGI